MKTDKSIEEKEILLQIIKDQIRRHRCFYIEDLYKLIFQITCGGIHHIESRSRAEKKLKDEWNNTEKIPKGETLLEIIDPMGEMMRVNIRVFKKISGQRKRLFNVFMKSAEACKKDEKRLIRYWEMIMDLAEKQTIPFSKDILEDFLIEQGKRDFPDIHHSDGYLDCNRPSYRVVLKRFWEGFETQMQE